MAILVVIFFFIFEWIAIAAIAVIAVFALIYLFGDHKRT
jgi:hypothetical protein